ncbi:unnamed protein product [Nyctereutes procyonoides]|uniref:(raccoon dog) hypothetical protein n=1 Tax=Nyctereutes procyonoides TaxID=34880 RepID=A0A811Z155_NYCPR|nr:unnamed protein product [Nyctereutes procyonoides]
MRQDKILPVFYGYNIVAKSFGVTWTLTDYFSPVGRAPCPGKRGTAGMGATPWPVTQRTLVGNLVLNHS